MTSGQRSTLRVLSVFAEFERAMIQERVRAGLTRARAECRKLGRPSVGEPVEARIRALRAEGVGILKIARTLKVGVSVVQRVTARPKQASVGRSLSAPSPL